MSKSDIFDNIFTNTGIRTQQPANCSILYLVVVLFLAYTRKNEKGRRDKAVQLNWLRCGFKTILLETYWILIKFYLWFWLNRNKMYDCFLQTFDWILSWCKNSSHFQWWWECGIKRVRRWVSDDVWIALHLVKIAIIDRYEKSAYKLFLCGWSMNRVPWMRILQLRLNDYSRMH